MESELEFEWDTRKNIENQRKHGVSFEDAMLVFSDPAYRCKYDWEHSFVEERWEAIGMIKWTIFTVNYTVRNERIRIISARKADKEEKEDYLNGYSTLDS